MPNWTYNRVYGSKKICDALLGEDRLPTFTKVIPVPKDLELVMSVKNDDYYKALYSSLFEHNDGPLKDLYHTRKISEPFEEWMKTVTSEVPLDILLAGKRMRDQYGTDYWYDWRCNNWGCKWDAKSMSDDPYEADVTEIEFETPWSPPEGVMNKIAELYPEEEFTWHCDEESCAFSFDRNYFGDGTYNEEDVLAEYYTPYIVDESELEEQCEGYEDVKDLRQSIKNALPEGLNFDLQEDEEAETLTVTVYDWDQYGGDLLYEHTFNGVKYK